MMTGGDPDDPVAIERGGGADRSRRSRIAEDRHDDHRIRRLGTAWMGGPGTTTMNDPCGELVVKLGKAQVEAMFDRQDKGPVIDDSEFLPLVESVLTTFETAGFDGEVVEELWEYAYSRYDRACKEAVPASTTAENIRLMRSYLLGPRRIGRRRR
jgi:hypothetical protein